MGSDDGAEICELVGLYILSLLSSLTYGEAAQYRDDGLMAVRGTPRQVEIKTKEVAKILKSTGISITIAGNLKTVDFLDLTLDLNLGTYKTYNKPNNVPLYVHKQSSHPPNVTKNTPLAVNQRISSNSSNKELFDETVAPFQQALKNSGYDHKLSFETPKTNSKNKRSKKRKMIYFNPPFSSGVKSQVGAQILKLVDTSFTKTNPLHKIFNRHTIKVSYRTTPNIQQIITSHNKKLLGQKSPVLEKKCTCRANTCPVEGKCKQEGTIYQATVKYTSPETGKEVKETYIGLDATTFYERHQNHKTTFKLRSHETKSELSKYLWQLKDKGKNMIYRGK